MTDRWRAPPVDRSFPDLRSEERAGLEQWLDFHRATLLTKCAGLTAEQLKQRAVPPSRLSLLGLVRHMTEVERWWFRRLDAFRAECESARAAAAGLSLDTVVPGRGHHPDRRFDIRWIFVHMIEEYARHNGHADLLRECIDGVTGD